MVTFPYMREKAHQAVLWLLHRHGGALDVLKLVKLIFFADRLHLFRYGRPVTGGRYVAMPRGPVASDLYDDLNSNLARVESLGAAGSKNPFPFEREGNTIRAVAPVNEDYLSESDIEVLEATDGQFGPWDTFRLQALADKQKAYLKNWKPDTGNKVFTLPYEDFFEDLKAEDPRRQMLHVIREDSEARDSLR